MTTPEDVIKAVNLILKTRFPNIPRESHDVKEGFDPGSFFVVADAVRQSWNTETFLQTSMTVRIFYFPESRYVNTKEIYKMQSDIVFAIGSSVKVNDDFYAAVTDVDYEITENSVLLSSIYMEFIQEIETEENADYMNELNYQEG